MDTFSFEGKTYRVFLLETEFGTFRVFLTACNYMADDSLAVRVYDIDEDGHAEPFATLTVNPGPFGEQDDRHAYLDTNDNGWAVRFLRDNGLATVSRTRTIRSGYCTYPLARFDTSKFLA